MINFYSTNNKREKADFKTALLKGLGSNYGLYTLERKSIPKISKRKIAAMQKMSYAQIAFEVVWPYLEGNISEKDLKVILNDAYNEKIIPTRLQHLCGLTHIMWLTNGPTYSFKDYAARFFGRILNHFLKKEKKKKVVIVATSGDTGGAVADALWLLDSIDSIIFFPKGSITKRQRRQMTTLQRNIYAFEVNGDFDVCQTLAKRILGDFFFAKKVFGDKDIFTSANSISIARFIPQAVYPFYAYSRLAKNHEPLIASVPSGNFGDMLGTVIAREMGLPISKIVCGVNENDEFPIFLETGKFVVKPSVKSPSSAMIVSNPSNFARLVDLYGGHVYDKRDKSGKVVENGVIDKMPDINSMRSDIFSVSVKNKEHYTAIKEAYEKYDVLMEPHGAVGYRVLDAFLDGRHDKLSVIYETADPGKFPDDVKKAVGFFPKVPKRMKEQEKLKERIYSIDSAPLTMKDGSLSLSDEQLNEAKEKIREIFA